MTTNGNKVTYGYSPSGARIRRTESGQNRYYLYYKGDLLMELDHNGNTMRRYTYLPGVDNPLSVRETIGGTDQMYYFAKDHPGHVTAVINTSNAIARAYEYTPFGTETTSKDGQPLRFMSRELDAGSGLYYVRNRWYDPTLARFVSEDPIGLQGGLNTYAYAENDPTNLLDPSGLQTARPNDSPSAERDVKLETVDVCTKKYAWGWDSCDLNEALQNFNEMLSQRWAAQRRLDDQATHVTPCTPATCPTVQPDSPAQRRAARDAADAKRNAEYDRCAAIAAPPTRRGRDVWHEVKHGLFRMGVGAAAGAVIAAASPVPVTAPVGAAVGGAAAGWRVVEDVAWSAWEALVDRAGERYKQCGGFFTPSF